MNHIVLLRVAVDVPSMCREDYACCGRDCDGKAGWRGQSCARGRKFLSPVFLLVSIFEPFYKSF